VYTHNRNKITHSPISNALALFSLSQDQPLLPFCSEVCLSSHVYHTYCTCRPAVRKPLLGD